MMKSYVLASALVVFSGSALADTVFNYDGFYSRMKKSEKVEFSDITLAFMLQKTGTNDPCVVDNAVITTDISEAPLTIANNGELILPYDELLNSRKALIVLKQPESAQSCDLNFKLRSKMPVPQQVTIAQLRKLQSQFDELLDSLAGLGKYWLPDVSGLTLHFATEVMAQSTDAAFQQQLLCEQTRCRVQLPASLADSATVEFSKVPDHATPLLQQP
ncbi:DUF2987 domain-containing protein [Rheinheimera sp. 1928-s]|uniref:DUF2987 domain-containing protein n=1 Tax=Rheinheimera sp. 1928-s TaxID=3033803 RepID=UPI002608ED29|nr:DUF2987 domain-containing protein [Rheinheimera sp. 1928-s]MDF3127323.1 DUF2987 domain-containing protein [Rheinheimera sp. 1928-s]